MWIESTAPRDASTDVLALEEHIIARAMFAHADAPRLSTTIDGAGPDPLQGAVDAGLAGSRHVGVAVDEAVADAGFGDEAGSGGVLSEFLA